MLNIVVDQRRRGKDYVLSETYVQMDDVFLVLIRFIFEMEPLTLFTSQRVIMV